MAGNGWESLGMTENDWEARHPLPRDHGTTGQRDNETTRLRDYETAGLRDYETARLLKNTGVLRHSQSCVAVRGSALSDVVD